MDHFSEDEKVVVAVRHQKRIRWFRAERPVWVLDHEKWRDSFLKEGFAVPNLDPNDRFGVSVVTAENTPRYLEGLKDLEVSKMALAEDLRRRIPLARSWWDVADIFPIALIDFDLRRLGAFYADGTRIERYVPDGWTSEFVDFSIVYPEAIFPAADKFWVIEGIDLLSELLSRHIEVGTIPPAQSPDPVSTDESGRKSSKFCPNIEAQLRMSGWVPGRAVPESEYADALGKLGFVASPAARNFLNEFFRLTIAYGAESRRGPNRMHIDPVRFGHGFQRLLIEQYSAEVGETLCPVGLIESENMNLFVGESGRVYAGVDDLLYLVGRDRDDALSNIFFDKEWKEVAATNRPISPQKFN